MKKIITVLLLLAITMPSSADWHAEASSLQAFGWGESVNKSVAKRIALRECAKRTPAGYMCYITNVYWVN